jgi:hypothetical protein
VVMGRPFLLRPTLFAKREYPDILCRVGTDDELIIPIVDMHVPNIRHGLIVGRVGVRHLARLSVPWLLSAKWDCHSLVLSALSNGREYGPVGWELFLVSQRAAAILHQPLDAQFSACPNVQLSMLISRLSLGLAAAGTAVCFWIAWRNPGPLLWWAYPYFLLPVAFALIPWRWRTRWGRVVAAFLLTAFLFSPWSFSVGLFFWPAALSMIVAAFLPIQSAAA